MSGIMALLSLDGRPISEELARRQLDAVAHRGDREPRLWLGAGVALGHANLPVTPEAEREHLPACDRSGRYRITWDGRIDNREELAQALRLACPDDREMTDAEYVLAAYERWGDACVRRLLGDWALVIWDARARRLFCAKDPVGRRPLFVAHDSGVLAVGSERQQLFAGGRFPRVVNREYLLRFLADAMQDAGETCYAGITELEGGQSLAVEDGALAVRRFWSYPDVPEGRYTDPRDCVDDFAAAFRVATKARLRSNRRIGVYLSGGIDSSYVAATAVSLGAPVTAISGYAPGTERMDERRYYRSVIEHLGIERCEVDLTDCWSLSSRWLSDAMFDQADHPVQSAGRVKLALAARTAGIGVTLGGEGGDEWFTGPDEVAADALLRGKPAVAWRLAGAADDGGSAGRKDTARLLMRDLFRAAAPFALQELVGRARGRAVDPGFSPLVRPRPGWVSVEAAGRAVIWRRARTLGAPWAVYRQECRGAVAWMERHAHGPHRLDHRTPFNDLRVIEVAAAIPPWMMRFRGREKDLVREAAYAVLPRTIPDRVDPGLYTELLYAGVAEHERVRARDGIETVARYPGVQGAAVRDQAARWLESRHRWLHPTWRSISAGLWLNHVDNARPMACRSAAHVSSLAERREIA